MSGNPFSPAKLIITLANGSVAEHDLGPAGLKVGRSPANDLVLEDSFASTNHAVFRADGAEWVIQDLGSANGTRINNARVSGVHVLRNGDVVQVGHTKFIFSQGAAAGGPVPPKYPEPARPDIPGAPFLRVFTGVGKEFNVNLTGTPVKIGRAPQNDIVLEDGFASTYHAEIRPYPGGWQITDMGSSNGTRVNDIRISGSQTLQTGDVVQIGKARISFSPSGTDQTASLAASAAYAAPPPYAPAPPGPAGTIGVSPYAAPPPVQAPPAYAPVPAPPAPAAPSAPVGNVPPGAAPVLVVVMPTGEHMERPVAHVPMGIGKAPHNLLVLNHPTVSASHAEIRFNGVHYEIVDFGSRNGTFVNDRPVANSACALSHGDKIRLGQVAVTFRNPSEKSREATVAVDLDQLMAAANLPPQEPKAEKKKKKEEEAGEEGGEKKKKKDKEKDKKKESRMASTVVNALSRIVAPLIMLVVTIYFITPTQKTGTTDTATQAAAIKTLQGASLTDISGAVFLQGQKTVVMVDGNKPKDVFSFTIDKDGNQLGSVRAIPHGAEVVSPKGIAFDPSRKFLYIIGSLASVNTGTLLRVRFDPASQTFTTPEVITNFRSFLLTTVPELMKVGEQYSESVAGIAWDAFNNCLLVAMPVPGGGETLVVPVRLRDDAAPFTTGVLEVSRAVSLLKGETVTEIQYDSIGQSVVLLALPKTAGAITAYRWNGQEGAKPVALTVTTPTAIDPRSIVHAEVDTVQFWFLLATNGAFTSAAAAPPPAAPAPAPAAAQ